MLLTDSEVKERIESPMNLLNRLRSVTNLTSLSPCLPPSSKDIIENLEEKIGFGSIKSKATNIMSEAMDELRSRLPEVTKPEKLAQIAAEMSKVVNGVVNNKIEDNRKIAQVIIYAPQILSESAFDVIEVSE